MVGILLLHAHHPGGEEREFLHNFIAAALDGSLEGECVVDQPGGKDAESSEVSNADFVAAEEWLAVLEVLGESLSDHHHALLEFSGVQFALHDSRNQVLEDISEFVNNLVSFVGSHGVLGVVSIAGSQVTNKSLRFVEHLTILLPDGETINFTSLLHGTVRFLRDSAVFVLNLGVIQKHTAGSCTAVNLEVYKLL